MLKEIHKCSPCDGSFATKVEYVAHKCPVTGHNPAEIEHQDALTDGAFSKTSEKALERGALRKGEETHPAAGK